MSKLCDGVIKSIRIAFPQFKIRTELYIRYKGQSLFVDIWLPQLNLAIEVNGRQHSEFVPFFHQSESKFLDSKKRDSLKEEWAGMQDVKFLVLEENELPISPEDIINRVNSIL